MNHYIHWEGIPRQNKGDRKPSKICRLHFIFLVFPYPWYFLLTVSISSSLSLPHSLLPTHQPFFHLLSQSSTLFNWVYTPTFSPMGIESSLYHSCVIHFIFIANLWGRFGWESLGQCYPASFHSRLGMQTWVSQVLVWHTNNSTTHFGLPSCLQLKLSFLLSMGKKDWFELRSLTKSQVYKSRQ